MTLKSDWEIVGAPVDPDSTDRLFFTAHEWATVEAATARIMPTDQDAGAREAKVVVFIDRYLSGIDYVYAAADGSGFLKITGKYADAWRARMNEMQNVYRHGLAQLDALAEAEGGKRFAELSDEGADRVLELLSGAPKPGHVTLGTKEPVTTFLQGSFDEGLDFFSAICLHTRQGFYCDPVYGGNKDQMGWKFIGFPGPKSLKDTMDGTYSTAEYFYQGDFDWEDLIPQLRAYRQAGGTL
ncbi:gluconate 2-dehydrogenase subunit 3 family protein [Cryobacterium gelidum]|uniref:Gluconate 2-dehydrogenase subunit 3 family protein n=1 Tax=Cryobacterium gelidum TaxID=1259164 RepID=A0A4R9B290_9MICO|nr:gluconate 2-dehydrogenase subunit 3 family protein [Cryobacterium gelidum]TFD73617.1 gluconate 2-dehydrogenase subunit 3 family protein [Cryobacterium gelidum]